MEKKSNNEISDLLSRLQQHVENGPDQKTIESKMQNVESTDELLDLLKQKIGTSASAQEVPKNSEYSIDGYELTGEEANTLSEESEFPELTTELDSGVTIKDSDKQKEYKTESDNNHTPEEETMLRQRVESLVKDALDQSEETDLLPDSENTTLEPFDHNDMPQSDPATASQSSISDIPPKDREVVQPEEVFSVDTEEIKDSEEKNEDTETSSPIEQTEDLEAGKTVPFETVSDDSVKEFETDTADEISEETEILDTEQKDEIFEPLETDHSAKENEIQSETIDAYEGVYLSESDMRRFFRFHNPGDASADTVRNDIFDSADLDDIDINLALSLGSKDVLENSIGYFRVRSARNGFYDPCLEESTGTRTYGYSDREFRSFDQVETIKKRYYTEQRKMSGRLIGTFVLAVLLLFWENIPLTAIHIPYLSDFLEQPLFYYGGASLLFFGCILLSIKRILKGLGSLFLLQGDPFVPVSCLTVFCLLYDLVILIFFRDAGLPAYNFAATVFLILGSVDDSMRLVHEKLSFDVISDRKPKLSLERFEGSIQSEKESTFLQKQEFFVEKVNFVGNFFSRSGRRPVQYSEYLHEFILSAFGALLITLLSTYITKDVAFAVNTFVFAVFVCVPMQFLTLGIYPFFCLTKGLSKLDSAVIGEAVIDEYQDADTIYLDDVEMFGKHGARIVGLRVYNDMDFYELLSYALSVFTAIGAPLCNVFDNSAKQIEKRDDARITNITVGGIEAVVGSFKTVLVGNIAFMRSKGFFPKRNPDDEKKAENGEISIMYMAIGGELCAKFYMQYTVTQRFEKFAAEMLKNKIKVGIRTFDPNVNEKMIAALRQDKDISIKVIRPTPNELIPIGKHSDSGIVTSKNSHMIFKILEQCFNIKRIHIRQKHIRLIELLFGFALSIVMMSLRLYDHIPSLYIALYQLIWMLPTLIYTKSNLK